MLPLLLVLKTQKKKYKIFHNNVCLFRESAFSGLFFFYIFIYKTMKQESNNITDTFFTKLKEQSFTIILLVGILYYQNVNFKSQIEEYKKMVDDKEALVLKLTEDERQRLLEREKYLREQRDKFVEDLINRK